jgi:hypothetical protein
MAVIDEAKAALEKAKANLANIDMESEGLSPEDTERLRVILQKAVDDAQTALTGVENWVAATQKKGGKKSRRRGGKKSRKTRKH